MKQGWEIKKLGEVATIVGGSTPKTNDFANWGGSNYWVTPAELTGNKWISSTERTITDLGVKNAHLQILPVGTVLLSSRAPIGKVAITAVEMYCNQGFKNIVCSENILNEFVYWFLFHNTDYLNSLGTGATFKEISKRVVEQIPIPVPERAEQERIVGELDCLSGIIAAKRAQLRELDTLAQSIFYTMFGDPITNDKGWQIVEIGELYDIGSSKRVFEAQWTDSGVPFYRAREIVRLSKNETIESPIFISELLYKEYSDKYGVPIEGDMMVTAVGTLGVCYIVKDSDRFYFKDGNILWFKNKGLCETRFIKDQYATSFVVNQIRGNANAAVVGTYTITNAKKTKVIMPPIAIQKEYVEKIENIELQKELITKSIKETEDLFNSRMDYYFN